MLVTSSCTGGVINDMLVAASPYPSVIPEAALPRHRESIRYEIRVIASCTVIARRPKRRNESDNPECTSSTELATGSV